MGEVTARNLSQRFHHVYLSSTRFPDNVTADAGCPPFRRTCLRTAAGRNRSSMLQLQTAIWARARALRCLRRSHEIPRGLVYCANIPKWPTNPTSRHSSNTNEAVSCRISSLWVSRALPRHTQKVGDKPGFALTPQRRGRVGERKVAGAPAGAEPQKYEGPKIWCWIRYIVTRRLAQLLSTYPSSPNLVRTCESISDTER